MTSTAALTVLGARGLGKSYGPSVVLDGVDLSIAEGERVGLVGLNGSGKSTLARILAGVEEPDVGEVARRRGATLRYLEQEPAFEPGVTARAAVTQGLAAWAEAKGRYERASAAIDRGEGELETALAAQAEAAADVERLGGWERGHEVDSLLGHLSVPDPEAEVARLSGGERRRVALARLLIARPDLAILDEPTNHLDVETIAWLEEFLVDEYPGALLLVTHDRYLLDRVTERTLELSRAAIYDYEGGYGRYIEAKAERLAHEARTESNRQNFLRREIEWLRRQPKARTTKQKARIDRAESAKAQKAPPKELSASLGLDEAHAASERLQVGDHFDEVVALQPLSPLPLTLRRATRYRVLAATPAVCWEAEGQMRDGWLRLRYAFSAHADGTRFERRLDYDARGASRLLLPLLRRRTAELSLRAMQNLKRRMESVDPTR